MDERSPRPEPAPPPFGGRSGRRVDAFDALTLVPEPLFCCDGEGWIVWLNRAAEELTGRAADELVGYAFPILFPPEERARFGRAFARRHLRGAPEFRCEVPLAAAGGSSRWVALRVRKLATRSRRVLYVCAAHDEQEARAELETLRRRTHELETRLEQSPAAARRRSDLLETVAARIRPPMQGVIGNTRRLLDSGLSGEQRDLAGVIESSGRALLRTIDELLDLLRVEAGRLQLDPLEFDVRSALESVAAALAPEAAGHGARVTVRVHHRVPERLQGDPGRLRQVLQTAAGGALRLGAGEIELRVELVEERAQDLELRFAVVAEGSDVDDARRDALLGCFVNPGGCVSGDGAGLGLLVARELVLLMGGETGLGRDEVGGAPECWFRLRLAKAAELPLPPPLPVTALEGLRVLVADPSRAGREAVSGLLAGWGCEADEAEDGLEAMEKLRAAAEAGAPYALAIVEYDLPVLNAERLAADVREDELLAPMLLVLVTALGRPGDAARAVEWGYAAYFVKPVPGWHLRDALLEMLRRHRTRRAGLTGAAGAPEPLVTRHTVAEQRRRRLHVLLLGDDEESKVAVAAALRRIGYAPVLARDADEARDRDGMRAPDLVLVDVEGSETQACELAAALRQDEGARQTPILALVGRPGRGAHPEGCGCVQACLPKPADLGAICSLLERWAHAEESAAHPADPASEAATIRRAA